MLIYAAISEKAAPDIAYNCTFVYQLLANVENISLCFKHFPTHCLTVCCNSNRFLFRSLPTALCCRFSYNYYIRMCNIWVQRILWWFHVGLGIRSKNFTQPCEIVILKYQWLSLQIMICGPHTSSQPVDSLCACWTLWEVMKCTYTVIDQFWTVLQSFPT